MEVKPPEYITEYGMSLMTVQKIKQHLLDLPSVIIQINSNTKIRALFEDKTKIMIMNEFQMFGNFFQKIKGYFK